MGDFNANLLRGGSIDYDFMRNSRLRFKHALRMCKNKKMLVLRIKLPTIYATKMTELFGEKFKM